MGKGFQPPIAFQALAETMSLGMTYQLAASPDGLQRRFTYVSESCHEMIGISAEELMADPDRFFDLVAPEHRELTNRITTEAIVNRTAMAVEFAIQRPDGEVRWIRSTSAPRAGSGGWWLWDGLQVDITENKRAELELGEHRRRLDMAVEATGLGFFDYDIRADRSVWSPRTRELYGLGPDVELTVDDWFENHIHPDDRAGMEAAYIAGLASPDGVFALEHRAVTPDGTVRWLLAHCRVLSDEAGPLSVLGTVLDITERKLAEERHHLITRELGHRAKNGLAMMLAIISQSARTATSVRELETMVSGRIRAMSRAQDLVTGERRALPLADLVAAAIEAFDGNRIVVDPALGEAELSGTLAFGLTLLLHELATNATKYGALTNATGKVYISRGAGPADKVILVWRERGGPLVTPPTHQGFGTRLLQVALKPQGGAAVTLYAPEGFEATLAFPSSLTEVRRDSAAG